MVDRTREQNDDLTISNFGGGRSSGGVEVVGTQGPPPTRATTVPQSASVQKPALKDVIADLNQLHTRMAWMGLAQRPVVGILQDVSEMALGVPFAEAPDIFPKFVHSLRKPTHTRQYAVSGCDCAPSGIRLLLLPLLSLPPRPAAPLSSSSFPSSLFPPPLPSFSSLTSPSSPDSESTSIMRRKCLFICFYKSCAATAWDKPTPPP